MFLGQFIVENGYSAEENYVLSMSLFCVYFAGGVLFGSK